MRSLPKCPVRGRRWLWGLRSALLLKSGEQPHAVRQKSKPGFQENLIKPDKSGQRSRTPAWRGRQPEEGMPSAQVQACLKTPLVPGPAPHGHHGRPFQMWCENLVPHGVLSGRRSLFLRLAVSSWPRVRAVASVPAEFLSAAQGAECGFFFFF